ncbi:MAG: hypothetical protein GY847_30125 [Proteobacteria bacterium]|nr:hypothetical protein [Pseudomonadota bacterium]
MSDESSSHTTMVTQAGKDKDSDESPMMSYTAVTSHQAMAEAFIRELVQLGQKMLPDHNLSTEDLITISQLALNRKENGVVILEGRHLRGRISEQISRAKRYKEPFSLLILKFDNQNDTSMYDSMVDTLCERLRKTDLMFLFKLRIALILPHTETEACQKLHERIKSLLKATVPPKKEVIFSKFTYPDDKEITASQILDWAEDELRT